MEKEDSKEILNKQNIQNFYYTDVRLKFPEKLKKCKQTKNKEEKTQKTNYIQPIFPGACPDVNWRKVKEQISKKLSTYIDKTSQELLQNYYKRILKQISKSLPDYPENSATEINLFFFHLEANFVIQLSEFIKDLQRDLQEIKEGNKENQIYFHIMHKSFFNEPCSSTGKEETTEHVSTYLNVIGNIIESNKQDFSSFFFIFDSIYNIPQKQMEELVKYLNDEFNNENVQISIFIPTTMTQTSKTQFLTVYTKKLQIQHLQFYHSKSLFSRFMLKMTEDSIFYPVLGQKIIIQILLDFDQYFQSYFEAIRRIKLLLLLYLNTISSNETLLVDLINLQELLANKSVIKTGSLSNQALEILRDRTKLGVALQLFHKIIKAMVQQKSLSEPQCDQIKTYHISETILAYLLKPDQAFALPLTHQFQNQDILQDFSNQICEWMINSQLSELGRFALNFKNLIKNCESKIQNKLKQNKIAQLQTQSLDQGKMSELLLKEMLTHFQYQLSQYLELVLRDKYQKLLDTYPEFSYLDEQCKHYLFAIVLLFIRVHQCYQTRYTWKCVYLHYEYKVNTQRNTHFIKNIF